MKLQKNGGLTVLMPAAIYGDGKIKPD